LYINLFVPLLQSRAWWPWPLYHRWGSCICMGFIYLKSSPFTISLFSQVSLNMAEQLFNYTSNISRTRPDDQLAVNYQLLQWNISWANPDMDVEKNKHPDFGKPLISSQYSRIDFNITSHHHYSGLIDYFPTHTSSVTLLPHSNYVRNCHNQTRDWRLHTPRMQKVVRKNLSNATVAHCRVSTGLGKVKRDYLAAYKLWMIPVSGY